MHVISTRQPVTIIADAAFANLATQLSAIAAQNSVKFVRAPGTAKGTQVFSLLKGDNSIIALTVEDREGYLGPYRIEDAQGKTILPPISDMGKMERVLTFFVAEAARRAQAACNHG